MSKFKDIDIERGGKMHRIREYELGQTVASKLQYILDEGPFLFVDWADLLFTDHEELESWLKGKTIPTDKNKITVINKYYRFLYEKNHEEVE